MTTLVRSSRIPVCEAMRYSILREDQRSFLHPQKASRSKMKPSNVAVQLLHSLLQGLIRLSASTEIQRFIIR